MHFSLTETLDAPIAPVFAIISDPRRRSEWQSSLQRVELQTPGPPRLGTRWREMTRAGISFEMEITAFDAPLRWSERASSWLADAQIQVSFAELGNATRLALAVDIDLKGPLRTLGPLVRPFMSRALRADLQRAGRLSRREHTGARAM